MTRERRIIQEFIEVLLDERREELQALGDLVLEIAENEWQYGKDFDVRKVHPYRWGDCGVC